MLENARPQREDPIVQFFRTVKATVGKPAVRQGWQRIDVRTGRIRLEEIIKRDCNQLLRELRVYRRISDKPGTDNAVIYLRHPGCARVAQPGDLHWRRLKGKRR